MQFIKFFVRKRGVFVLIGMHSLDSMVGMAFEHTTPRDKVDELGYYHKKTAESILTEQKELLEESIRESYKVIEAIKGFNNTVDEKLNSYHYETLRIGDLNKQLEDVKKAMAFVDFLFGIDLLGGGDCKLYAGNIIDYPTKKDIRVPVKEPTRK